jgi:uncharacterized protein (TIGR02466 family)
MNIIDTFAMAPVCAFDYKGDMEEIIHVVNSLDYGSDGTNSKSKDTYVLDQLPNLKTFCIDSCEEYAKKICGATVGIDIQQSWVNINYTGDSAESHWHSNSYLSGVFYIASNPKDGSPIRFSSSLRNFSYYPNESAWGKNEDNGEINPYTSSNCDLASIPTKLLVFSSLLPHSVPVNRSQDPRVSLSFNTTPSRPYGDEDRLNRIT